MDEIKKRKEKKQGKRGLPPCELSEAENRKA